LRKERILLNQQINIRIQTTWRHVQMA